MNTFQCMDLQRGQTENEQTFTLSVCRDRMTICHKNAMICICICTI